MFPGDKSKGPQDGKCEILFSVKNQTTGLSKHIFESDPGEPFAVRGLVGKGLCLQNEGVHIAFTTITGALAFLDLAALLLRVNLGLLSA